ncbi:MAG: DUF6431 domain-containing protein, partial [Bryobacteraceae bacterium]|nr:DUF6431 domain-containing protein [Bryobacteraceae bacterium]
IRIYRPISGPHAPMALSRKRYSFPVGSFSWEARAPLRVPIVGKVLARGRAPIATILVIPLSADQFKPGADWAEAVAEVILRRCPVCSADSIIGHGRRRKQAHDEYHDWIGIRRGLCNRCGKTFTFLPPFSPPYSHYSLVARSQALLRYFVEGRTWEDAAPAVKDPDRVADPSTLRRWFRSLDSSRPPFSFLRDTMVAISTRLGRAEILVHDSLPLRWHSVFPFLARFWPLRL